MTAPKNVLEKAERIKFEVALGKHPAAFNGKVLASDRNIVSVPIGYSWRLLFMRTDKGFVPSKLGLMSHESYNKVVDGGGRTVHLIQPETQELLDVSVEQNRNKYPREDRIQAVVEFMQRQPPISQRKFADEKKLNGITFNRWVNDFDKEARQLIARGNIAVTSSTPAPSAPPAPFDLRLRVAEENITKLNGTLKKIQEQVTEILEITTRPSAEPVMLHVPVKVEEPPKPVSSQTEKLKMILEAMKLMKELD